MEHEASAPSEKFGLRAKGTRKGFDTKQTGKTIRYNDYYSMNPKTKGYVSEVDMDMFHRHLRPPLEYSLDKHKRWEQFDPKKNSRNMEENNFVVVTDYATLNQQHAGDRAKLKQIHREQRKIKEQQQENESAEDNWTVVTGRRQSSKQAKRPKRSDSRQKVHSSFKGDNKLIAEALDSEEKKVYMVTKMNPPKSEYTSCTRVDNYNMYNSMPTAKARRREARQEAYI